MDENQKEITQEEELLKPSKEEEVRSQVIETLGLNEVDDAELIDKLTQEKLADRKRFGELVGQKRSWREKALKQPEPQKPTDTGALSKEEVDRIAETKANEILDKRDLNDLNLPDELKSEVQKIARNTGVSVRQAAKDPYIQFKVDAWKKQQQEEEATLSRKNNATGSTTYDPEKPPRVDMSTEEGRKKWKEWKEKAGRKHS